MIETKLYPFKFELGSEVEDMITGFRGIVACRSQWLNGCNTYGARSQKLKDGIPSELQYFDEPQLRSIESDKFQEERSTGGPEKRVPISNRF